VCGVREGLDGATIQQQQQPQQRSGTRDDNDDENITTQLSLKCQTEGRPAPSVEWLRNYIRSVARMTLSPFSAAATGPRSLLPRDHVQLAAPWTAWFIEPFDH